MDSIKDAYNSLPPTSSEPSSSSSLATPVGKDASGVSVCSTSADPRIEEIRKARIDRFSQTLTSKVEHSIDAVNPHRASTKSAAEVSRTESRETTPVETDPEGEGKRDFSEQDEFEGALRNIRGEGIVENNQVGNTPKTDHLDGVGMIAQIAEEKIEFPLHHLTLSDFSPKELCYALAFALQENIKKVDRQITSWKTGTAKPQNFSLQEGIQIVEGYKKNLTQAVEILNRMGGKDGAEDDKEVSFIFEVIKKIHQSFSISENALFGLSEGAPNNAFLSHLANARMLATEEETRENPREEIIAGYNESFDLYDKAEKDLEERESMDPYQHVYFLSQQAHIRILVTEEKSRENPREEIIAGYNESFDLYGKALEALKAENAPRTFGLANQSLVRFRATEEKSRENPREEIIDRYNESFDLYTKALDAEAAQNIDLAFDLADEAHELFLATEEEAIKNSK